MNEWEEPSFVCFILVSLLERVFSCADCVDSLCMHWIHSFIVKIACKAVVLS
jgi:hypothetical protein